MNVIDLDFNQHQLSLLLRKYGVVDVRVFGSFARGDAGPQSDLDLLVTYKPGTTLLDVMSLQDELEQIFGRKVDLVSERHLSQRLASRIKQDVKPLN